MAITDYNTLRTAIADYSHRTDLTNQLDTFIQLAEKKIAADLRVREMESSVTGTFSSITEALPADFGKLRRLTIDVGSYKHCPVNIGAIALKEKYQPGGTVPAYFAQVGSSLEFNCNPTGYNYTLDYYLKPTAITSLNTTSDLLTAYPDVYLYACLVELAWYTKNDQDITRYTGRYADVVRAANSVNQPNGGSLQVVTV